MTSGKKEDIQRGKIGYKYNKNKSEEAVLNKVLRFYVNKNNKLSKNPDDYCVEELSADNIWGWTSFAETSPEISTLIPCKSIFQEDLHSGLSKNPDKNAVLDLKERNKEITKMKRLSRKDLRKTGIRTERRHMKDVLKKEVQKGIRYILDEGNINWEDENLTDVFKKVKEVYSKQKNPDMAPLEDIPEEERMYVDTIRRNKALKRRKKTVKELKRLINSELSRSGLAKKYNGIEKRYYLLKEDESPCESDTGDVEEENVLMRIVESVSNKQ